MWNGHFNPTLSENINKLKCISFYEAFRQRLTSYFVKSESQPYDTNFMTFEYVTKDDIIIIKHSCKFVHARFVIRDRPHQPKERCHFILYTCIYNPSKLC